MNMKQAVTQGCVASPHFMVLYTEIIMMEVDNMDGSELEEHFLIHLRYTDHTVIIVESTEQRQSNCRI